MPASCPASQGESQVSDYIKFVKEGQSPSGLTELWTVESKSSGDALGYISWYGPWRQYTFNPEPNTTYSHDCLLAISRFCYGLNQDQRSKKEKTK
jgi:hypothetical protein